MISNPGTCKYEIIHPYEDLFINKPENNTGYELNYSHFKKNISKSGIWNQSTYDGLIPEFSVYISSNCILYGSIRRRADAILIERFSGNSIPLKEIYLPSKKLIKFAPMSNLRQGSAYIFVLKAKDKENDKIPRRITKDTDSDYFDRLARIAGETAGIKNDDIIYISEIHVRSMGSLIGPVVRIQNIIASEYGNMDLEISSMKTDSGIVSLEGAFISPVFCSRKKCRIKTEKNNLAVVLGKKRVYFKVLIPENASSLKILQFSNENFEYRNEIFHTNFFHKMLQEGSLSAVILKNPEMLTERPGPDNADRWFQSIMEAYLLSHHMKFNLRNILKKRNISVSDTIKLAGFGSSNILTSEMILNHHIDNHIVLESDITLPSAEAKIFLSPESEMEKLNFEGLLPETYVDYARIKQRKILIKSILKESDRNRIYSVFRR